MSEILGALFKYLVSLLGVAAVVLILYQVFSSNKTQNAISDISLTQANVQSLYNAQSTFNSLTNNVAISGKLVPTSMISGAALINQWGGPVTIAANPGNGTQFMITETSVPADSCAKMIVGIGSIVGLQVNSVSQTLPLDPGLAVTACNAAVGNTLAFTFTH